MPFASTPTIDMPNIGSGELFGTNNTVLSATVFENGLVMGRFAKLAAGSIDNIDASVAPVVAGVVKRDVSGAIEQGSAVDADTTTKVEYVRAGMITVDVVAGNTPAQFGSVFVHNLADANAGKATTVNDATTEATKAEFIEQIATDVWLVRLT